MKKLIAGIVLVAFTFVTLAIAPDSVKAGKEICQPALSLNSNLTKKEFQKQANKDAENNENLIAKHLDTISKKVFVKNVTTVIEEERNYNKMLSLLDFVNTTNDSIKQATSAYWDTRTKNFNANRDNAAIKGFLGTKANLKEYAGQTVLAGVFKEHLFKPLFQEDCVAEELANEFSYIFTSNKVGSVLALGKFQEKLINRTFDMLNGVLEGTKGNDDRTYFGFMASMSNMVSLHYSGLKSNTSESILTNDLVNGLKAIESNYKDKLLNLNLKSKKANSIHTKHREKLHKHLMKYDAAYKKEYEAAKKKKKEEKKEDAAKDKSEFNLSTFFNQLIEEAFNKAWK